MIAGLSAHSYGDRRHAEHWARERGARRGQRAGGASAERTAMGRALPKRAAASLIAREAAEAKGRRVYGYYDNGEKGCNLKGKVTVPTVYWKLPLTVRVQFCSR